MNKIGLIFFSIYRWCKINLCSALLPFFLELLCPGLIFFQDFGYVYHCISRGNWAEIIPVFLIFPYPIFCCCSSGLCFLELVKI